MAAWLRQLCLVSLLGIAAAAGCGGASSKPSTPLLPRTLASSLAAGADQVAHLLDTGNGCAAHARALALQQTLIGAINEHRVPAVYQEPLLGNVNLLLERVPCSPASTTSAATTQAPTTTQAPPPAPLPPGLAKKGHKDHRHGPGKGGDNG